MQNFKRYAGAPDDNGVKMPSDALNASSEKLTIGELVGRLETFDSEGGAMYPWADRFVMGYPLPSFQRKQVWTPLQKMRFVESIWSRSDIGSYLVNDVSELKKTATGVIYQEMSDALLDGQQRLSAMEDYLRGRFAVADSQGTPRFWAELGKIERRRFCATTFTRSVVRSFDETLLRKAYDLRAFGGTAHDYNERASSM
ncbi:DUF262 domain-containing protein [Burkholderia cenocepacia]|uniref:DUF262 domain-containing protein n=1 Tax=Burkholderia cenocepacia TaxID=95486 RepID=UPI000760FBDE|nr:DUF262 domain-containing protein [Burkholderia cenocepacia]KWU17948.1 hypothetical protein AS149_14840 [Burkholderia cenocepacia]